MVILSKINLRLLKQIRFLLHKQFADQLSLFLSADIKKRTWKLAMRSESEYTDGSVFILGLELILFTMI